MDQDRVEVHMVQKKNKANIQPSGPNTLGAIKNFLYGFGEIFLWDTVLSSMWAR